MEICIESFLISNLIKAIFLTKSLQKSVMIKSVKRSAVSVIFFTVSSTVLTVACVDFFIVFLLKITCSVIIAFALSKPSDIKDFSTSVLLFSVFYTVFCGLEKVLFSECGFDGLASVFATAFCSVLFFAVLKILSSFFGSRSRSECVVFIGNERYLALFDSGNCVYTSRNEPISVISSDLFDKLKVEDTGKTVGIKTVSGEMRFQLYKVDNLQVGFDKITKDISFYAVFSENLSDKYKVVFNDAMKNCVVFGREAKK